MGLVIILALGLYLAIAIGVVLWAISYAKKNGKSAARWGWGAALGMYLLVFWDWLPTVVAHKYYCATEAGFWVYKTPEQWMKENPGVMKGLHQILQPNKQMPYGDLSLLDERFAIETHRRTPVPFIPTRIAERLLVDRKTAEVLAKSVEVGSGVGNMATGEGFKFWLNQKPCMAMDFWKLTTEIQNMRGQK
jgi:hypothetical protein